MNEYIIALMDPLKIIHILDLLSAGCFSEKVFKSNISEYVVGRQKHLILSFYK